MQTKLIWFAIGFAAAVAASRLDVTKKLITGGNKFFG
jgi:hypothetical protein